jgi:hypothetical protein
MFEDVGTAKAKSGRKGTERRKPIDAGLLEPPSPWFAEL